MKIVKNFNGDPSYGVIPYLQKEFEKFNNEDSEIVLFNGVEFIDNKNIRDEYKQYSRRILFAHWSPCEFTLKKDYFYFDAYEFFTDIYCVCPFTCEFMNQYFGENKFKYIPYPYTNYSITEFNKYDSTVCWFGSISGNDHISAIETIKKYKYKFITSQRNTWMHHPYEYNLCTHVNISTEKKLEEVSKCKASLTFNKLYMSPASINNKQYKNILHQSFDQFEKKHIMPQFKARTHEIASCKSLILCMKDEWNLIEHFYTKNEEFLYFKDFNELDEILEDIDKNIEKYTQIINNAYNRVQNFSVSKIFKYIETQDQKLITWKT